MLTPAAAAASEYGPSWRLRWFEGAFLAESVDEVDMVVLRGKFKNSFLAQGEKNTSASAMD
jgi:hypothetical protein